MARRVRAVDLADTGNLESWLTPRREMEGALTAAGAVIESVRAANDRAAENIAAAVRPGAKEVALRFRGLEFARFAEGQLAIGVGDARREPGPLHAARDRSFAAANSISTAIRSRTSAIILSIAPRRNAGSKL